MTWRKVILPAFLLILFAAPYGATQSNPKNFDHEAMYAQMATMEFLPIINSVENEFIAVLNEIGDKYPQSRLRQSVQIALQYCGYMKKLAMRETKLKGPQGGDLFLGRKAFQKWAEDMRGLGIKCQDTKGVTTFTFPWEAVKQGEKVALATNVLTTGEKMDLYVDSNGRVVVPGLSFLRQELQQGK